MADIAVYAFAVSVVGDPWPATTVNARSRGQAKAEYFSLLHDCWPDIPWTALRVRKLGPAQTSEDFRRTARYRGWMDARCGDLVRAKDGSLAGVIVGSNESCNFDILVTSGRHEGQIVAVHPHYLEPAGV